MRMWAMARRTLSGAPSSRSERLTCSSPSRRRMVVLRETKRRKRMWNGGIGARGLSARYSCSKIETTLPAICPELTRRGLAGIKAFASLLNTGVLSLTKSKLALCKGCVLLYRGIGRRLGKLLLPLEDSCASCRCFGLGNLPRLLQGDRKTGLRQRVVWSERCQGDRCSHRGFELLSIAERANQPMMRFDMRTVGGNRLAKSLDRT